MFICCICYTNRAAVSALCLVVLLITFLMFYCVLWIYLSKLNVCMYVCMYGNSPFAPL